jgi:hypothetical protein
LGTQETFCIVIAGLLERDSFDLFLPEFDKPWVIHLRETCCCSRNLCTWRPNTVYKNRRVRRHQCIQKVHMCIQKFHMCIQKVHLCIQEDHFYNTNVHKKIIIRLALKNYWKIGQNNCAYARCYRQGMCITNVWIIWGNYLKIIWIIQNIVRNKVILGNYLKIIWIIQNIMGRFVS